MKCPDCGGTMAQRYSPKFDKGGPYGGRFYGCLDFPRCRGVHSVDSNTGKPLGKPANAATREARKEAHKALDELQARTGMGTGAVYRLLQKELNKKPEKCHIAQFDIATCRQVCKVARNHKARV